MAEACRAAMHKSGNHWLDRGLRRGQPQRMVLMKIAEVSPLAESVPPKLYGGTERVVSWLTEALVADGHEVTLFASGDSLTSATLEPMCRQGLRLSAIN